MLLSFHLKKNETPNKIFFENYSLIFMFHKHTTVPFKYSSYYLKNVKILLYKQVFS